MKTYLRYFLDLFSYPEEARLVLMKAFDRINSNCELRSEFDKLLNTYSEDRDCDFCGLIDGMKEISAKAEFHPYEGNLLLLICLSEKLKQNYAETGLDQQIWITSMYDLKWKMMECCCVYGICGIFVPTWFDGFFKMERYGFGKLQFELVPFKAKYEKNGIKLSPNSTVINVHIPRTGTKLDRKSLINSYEEAAEFFRKRYKIDRIIFVCHSWLLFPRNLEVLSSESNLHSFISDYDIVAWGTDDDYAEVWRLFDINYNGDIRKLPQNTSLRRAYANWIRNGEKVGWGYGVFVYH